MKPTFTTIFLAAMFLVFITAGSLLLVGLHPEAHPFRLIIGIMLMLAALSIAARPIVFILTSRSGTLFYPDHRPNTTPPAYSTAEACRLKNDFAGALSHYETILATHPRELRAYVAIVEIALDNVDNAPLAKLTLDRGLAALAEENHRCLLRESYDESVARREKKERPTRPG